jgi:hypothetical protein
MPFPFFQAARLDGRCGNAEFRRPALYEPTYLNTVDCQPTHDWRRIQTIEQVQMAVRAARKSAAKKQKSSGGNRTVTSSGIRTENPDFPVVESLHHYF